MEEKNQVIYVCEEAVCFRITYFILHVLLMIIVMRREGLRELSKCNERISLTSCGRMSRCYEEI